MLMSAYFYTDACEDGVVPRRWGAGGGGAGWKDRAFLKLALLLGMEYSRINPMSEPLVKPAIRRQPLSADPPPACT